MKNVGLIYKNGDKNRYINYKKKVQVKIKIKDK